MSDATNKAVFLSYASQDAAAARRICDALRAAGVEVWFDQNELVGGDVWDGKIRRQIAECALFIPIISANTQARLEGYFRLEWKLAAQRTHTMAEEKAFLLPVVIDDTRDADAKVPGEFRAVQWTRLRNGETLTRFCERVKALVGEELAPQVSWPAPSAPPRAAAVQGKTRSARGWVVASIVGIALVAALALWRNGKQSEPLPAVAVADKSVAVLPFVNVSGDPEQEYFSDGLTEEILNALARESDLRVPGRASVFSFKGSKIAPAEIARALNVTRLVEGSVRRDGKRVKITFQLIRAADGFSEDTGNFTEEVTDVFALQERVAGAVVEKLTRRKSATAKPGLTRNPEAYEEYLRGRAAQMLAANQSWRASQHYERAVAIDPGFALAWTRLGEVRLAPFRAGVDDSASIPPHAREAIEQALRVQPDLPEALIVRANWLRLVESDIVGARRDLAKAAALQPITADLRREQAELAAEAGDWRDALRLDREGFALDPQNGEYAHSCAIRAGTHGDYARADSYYARAMLIQGPQSPNAFQGRVALRVRWRGPEAALRLVDRVPTDQSRIALARAGLLAMLGRLDEARQIAAPLKDSPRQWFEGGLTLLLMQLGFVEEARHRAEERRTNALSEMERGNRASSIWSRWVEAEIVLGHPDAAVAALGKWQQEIRRQPASRRRAETRASGDLYSLLGLADEATAVLREQVAGGVQFGMSLRYDLKYARIRSDPRFQLLMNQAEAWARSQPDPSEP